MKIKIIGALLIVFLLIPFATAYTQDDVYTEDLNGDGYIEYKAELQYGIDNYEGTSEQLLEELERVCTNELYSPDARYTNWFMGEFFVDHAFYNYRGYYHFRCVAPNKYRPNTGYIVWEARYDVDENPLDMELINIYSYGWKFDRYYGTMFPVMEQPTTQVITKTTDEITKISF